MFLCRENQTCLHSKSQKLCQFFLFYDLGVQTLQQALRARLFVWEEIVSEKMFSSHIVRQLSLTACLSFKTDLFQVW